MAVRALAAPWSVFGTLGGGGFHSTVPFTDVEYVVRFTPGLYATVPLHRFTTARQRDSHNDESAL
eukprot:3027223-Prymnesium_polylepis.1